MLVLKSAAKVRLFHDIAKHLPDFFRDYPQAYRQNPKRTTVPPAPEAFAEEPRIARIAT